MQRILLVLLILLLVFQSAFAVNKRFTGTSGSNWQNPNNWIPPGVPGPNDNVVIPPLTWLCHIPVGNVTVNSLTNHGNIQCGGGQITTGNFQNEGRIYSEGKLIIDAPDGSTLYFDNNGHIEAPNGLLAIAPRNYEGSYTTISGYIEGKYVYINAQNLITGSDFTTIYGDFINIQVLHDFTNFEGGRILGKDNSHSEGGSVLIKVGNNFINHCAVKGGRSDWSFGGSVDLVVGGTFTNFPYARTQGGDGIRDGYLRLECKTLNNHGTLKGGYCPIIYKSPTDTATMANVIISADSIYIEDPDSIIGGDTLRFVGRVIVVNDLTESPHIYGENGIYFYTLPGSRLDFSGIEVWFPIICQFDFIYLFSNDIIPPDSGLGSIMIPGPFVFPADTGVVNGSINWSFYTAVPGESDSFLLEMKNLTPVPKTLFYGVTSRRGWAPPLAGTTSSKPFLVSESLWIYYTIPEDTPVDFVDTVRTILAINPSFVETVYSYLGVFPPTEEQDTLVFNITAGWNMLSFPFTDTLRLPDCFPSAYLPPWGFFLATRTYDWIEFAEAGMGFWLLFEEDTTLIFTGFNPLDTLVIELEPGWHMFGGPDVVVPIEMLTDYPEVFESVFGWDAETRSYFIADFIYPGACYWVFVDDTVEIRIPR